MRTSGVNQYSGLFHYYSIGDETAVTGGLQTLGFSGAFLAFYVLKSDRPIVDVNCGPIHQLVALSDDRRKLSATSCASDTRSLRSWKGVTDLSSAELTTRLPSRRDDFTVAELTCLLPSRVIK